MTPMSQARLRPAAKRVRFLFRDGFSDAVSAGGVNGTKSSDSLETRAATDTENKLSVSGGYLNFAKKATASLTDPSMFYGSRARAAGLALFTGPITVASGTGGYIGFGEASAPGTPLKGAISADTNITFNPGAVNTAITRADLRNCAIVLQTAGSLLFAKLASASGWKFAWADLVDATATVYPGVAANDATGTLDWLRLASLPAPFNTDWALVTQRLAGARASGTTFVHEADFIFGWTVVTRPSDAALMQFRMQDGSNCWSIYIYGSGSITLNEIVAGGSTLRGSAGSGSIANGQRMNVVGDGSTIRVYANGVLKITYSSANNFKTATNAKLVSTGSGGAVSDIISWPRNLRADYAAILDRYVR